ncbi:MAG: lipopolysaccharide kinase InaA family protein [Desulfobacteraceae bacterium]
MSVKTGYTAVTIGAWRGWGCGPARAEGFQTRLKNLLREVGGATLPSGRDHRVYPLTWSGRTYFVKHYQVLTFKSRLQCGLGCSKAHKAWRYARILRRAGISTPRAVAYLQQGFWLGAPEQLLITEGVSGTTLRERVREPLPLPARRRLIKALARFLARIHDTGIYHGDFSAFNILVAETDGDPLGWKIHLIDLDAIRTVKHISRRRQIKNLDELGRNFTRLAEVSVMDRLRFLHHYVKARQRLWTDLPALKTVVCRRTAARMRTYGKRFIAPDP